MDQSPHVVDGTDTGLQALDLKLKTVLPAVYQESYEDMQPVSMGSAGLKFDASGRVAWDEIWRSFCDLAMAGGPPHRGTLLLPAVPLDSERKAHRAVVDEICRGIRLVSRIAVDRCDDHPQWIQLLCGDEGMAGWMARAIAMENVSALQEGSIVRLPAGPHYRLEKEIKNVITSVAKTAHYYVDHMAPAQRRSIAELFSAGPFLQPGSADSSMPAPREIAGFACVHDPIYPGWLGLQCPTVRVAIWMMRALSVNGVMARREQAVLFVPVNSEQDPNGDRVEHAVTEVRRLGAKRGICLES